MMIKKIISGGKAGAEQAALDVAIKNKIPNGGWVPKGRLAENVTLSNKYQLQEMSVANYSKIIEQNVIDSDGTLIFSRGKLTVGSDYAREMTLKHRKQLLGINLNISSHQKIAPLIASWIPLQHIQYLNITGPEASEDSRIYSDVFIILALAIDMLGAEERTYSIKIKELENFTQPKTVAEAVEILTSGISLRDRMYIASLDFDDLNGNFQFSLGLYIRNQFGLWADNKDLLESCRKATWIEDKNIHPDTASSIIIKALWQHIRKTHKIRVVK